MRSYALDEIPWSEVERALVRDPRLIFPVGALEQHGPHLPLGANIVIAQRVAREVSRTLQILRAPTFSYGVTIGGGPFAGRAGLRRKTLHRAVNELLAEWEDHGVKEFVIITAHRFEPHLEALLMALTGEAMKSVYDLYEIDVSDLLETDPELEHAGELERPSCCISPLSWCAPTTSRTSCRRAVRSENTPAAGCRNPRRAPAVSSDSPPWRPARRALGSSSGM